MGNILGNRNKLFFLMFFVSFLIVSSVVKADYVQNGIYYVNESSLKNLDSIYIQEYITVQLKEDSGNYFATVTNMFLNTYNFPVVINLDNPYGFTSHLGSMKNVAFETSFAPFNMSNKTENDNIEYSINVTQIPIPSFDGQRLAYHFDGHDSYAVTNGYTRYVANFKLFKPVTYYEISIVIPKRPSWWFWDTLEFE